MSTFSWWLLLRSLSRGAEGGPLYNTVPVQNRGGGGGGEAAVAASVMLLAFTRSSVLRPPPSMV